MAATQALLEAAQEAELTPFEEKLCEDMAEWFEAMAEVYTDTHQ